MAEMAEDFGSFGGIPSVLGIITVTFMACAPQTTSRAPGAATSACQTSPGDDACDLCTAAKCCPEETACMSEATCKSADDDLDACEAKAEKAGRGLPSCYDTFAATGVTAKKRADCIRSSCSKECLSP
jgi:hypothetical protein